MRRIFKLCCVLFVLSFLHGCGKVISVKDLKCEFLTDPLSIDNTAPYLSWKMQSSGNGVSSSAYQILVATAPDKLNEEEADLWNSGKVEAPNTVIVQYEGSPLGSKDLAWWKVRVWDQDGVVSEWSAAAFFGIGLLDKDAWSEDAVYIGLADNDASPEAAPLLRKSFDAEPSGSMLLLHVNSLGYHEAYINGQPVSDAVLTPAVSEFDKRSLIVTYNVTPLVKEGENELLLWLGKGWYQTIAAGVEPGGPYVRAQLDAVSAEGADVLAVTDGSWSAAESDRRSFGTWGYRDLGGEIVDSRCFLPDLKPETIEKLAWKPVRIADIPDHVASPQMCELNRITDTCHPVSVHQVSDTCFIYDLGRTLTGFTEIKMPPVPDGTRIELHYDDLILEDFKDFRDGVYVDYYIGNGRSEGTFSSRFNYKAYRYLKIKGLTEALPLEHITASAIRTDYESESGFECSDKDMNDICQMIHRTFHALILGGDMVDCPHRERLGYGGDGNASTPSAQIMADLAPLYLNWIQAYADSQIENGSMPHTGPNPYRAGGGPYWCTFIIPASWHSYVNYGDRRMIDRYYPNMQKWLEFAESNYKGGILKDWGVNEQRHWYLGDWATPEGINQKDSLSIDIVSNCVMSQAYGLMEKIADVLEKKDDAEKYAARRAAQNDIIHKTFYDEQTSLYSTGTQVDMAYPMLVGATPDSCVDKVREALLEETAERFKGHLSAGLVGVPVLTQWATAAGEAGFMYSMLKKRDCPGYLYMIDKGAHTTWEYWNGIKSQIHNCYNGIGSWFYQALAGICPDEKQPGYRHVYIRPQLVDGLDWVKASKSTPYGILSVDWRLDGGRFIIKVEVPVGSSATVFLPDGSEAVTLGSGRHRLLCRMQEEMNI